MHGGVEDLVETADDGVSPERLRAAIGHFATGVSVITSATADGRPIGSTANALASVSLHPPLVLACLRDESDTLAALLAHGHFAINVLHADQHALAERFANRDDHASWRGIASYAGAHGVPLLDGALSTLECALHDVADGGDHTVVIGRVLAVSHPDTHVAPLLFYRGRYAHMQPPREQPAAEAAAQARPPEERLARVLTPPSVELLGDVFIPTRDGEVSLVPVDPHGSATTSVLVLVGEPRATSGSLVYMHRGCLLGDALGHLECRRRNTLAQALERIRDAGAGLVVYHRDDSAPFSGCCAQAGQAVAPSPHVPEPALAGLREALASLRLREVRLLSGSAEAQPLPPALLGLDVTATEPLHAATRLRACAYSPS